VVIRISGNQGVGYQGIRGSGKRIDTAFLGHGLTQINTDSSIVSNHGFGLRGKSGGQKKITKFAKKLAKSIGFVLEWYQWAG